MYCAPFEIFFFLKRIQILPDLLRFLFFLSDCSHEYSNCVLFIQMGTLEHERNEAELAVAPLKVCYPQGREV